MANQHRPARFQRIFQITHAFCECVEVFGGGFSVDVAGARAVVDAVEVSGRPSETFGYPADAGLMEYCALDAAF